jgi:hypothetical protein
VCTGNISKGENATEVVRQDLKKVFGYSGDFCIFQAEPHDSLTQEDGTVVTRYAINIVLQSDYVPIDQVQNYSAKWKDVDRVDLYSIY